MLSSYARNAIVLGLLAAVGPFAIDMYVPALPTITADLQTTTAATQMTLLAFFLGFGLSQLAYGPVSDMVGRKPPLYFGLGLFVVGAMGGALSPSIEWLIAFRVIQGIGGASVMVVPRAVIRDLHTGIEATRLMSLVMLILSVSPILAPLAGSALIVPFGWRSVFVVAAIAALAGLVLTMFVLPETWPRERRVRSELRSVVVGYGSLLRHPRFMGLTFIGGLGMASFFAFLASSSFIYIDHFGLTPVQYSFAFSANAIGFIGASQFSARLGQRFGMARVVSTAVAVFAAFAVLLFLLTAMGVDSLAVLIVLLICANAALGLVIPATMVLSLEEHGPIAGMASALGGTLQMVAGGVVIGLVSLSFDGTALPMVTAIALCAVGALLLSRLTLRGRQALPQPAE
jgi:DHA1 family bicyclomycin/chloramphenicol resistance-like MFS transporter